LTNGIFARANLSDASLSGSDKGASFANANLTGATLTGDFSRANFSGADLSQANISGAVLSHANFTGAVLSNATIQNSTLIGTVFTGVDVATVAVTSNHGDPIGLTPFAQPNLTLNEVSNVPFDIASLLVDGSKMSIISMFNWCTSMYSGRTIVISSCGPLLTAMGTGFDGANNSVFPGNTRLNFLNLSGTAATTVIPIVIQNPWGQTTSITLTLTLPAWSGVVDLGGGSYQIPTYVAF